MIPTQRGKKMVVIKSSGVIPSLGGISGPITSPTWIATPDVIRLINDGAVVYEVNPSNPAETVKLNRLNVSTNNFKEAVIASKNKIETSSSKRLAERVEKGQINGMNIRTSVNRRTVSTSDFN